MHYKIVSGIVIALVLCWSPTLIYAQSLVSFKNDISIINEDIGDVSVLVGLDFPSDETVKVYYSVTGGTAYGIKQGYQSESGIVYGTGLDHNLSEGTITFEPGETEQVIKVPIIDDTVFEANETVEIIIAEPENALLGSIINHNVNIVDDDRPLLVDVKNDFGAIGDGVNDDTFSIQNAIDYINASGGGVVLFPPGTYLVSSINIYPNITYHGYGATITRPPNMGKWNRTFKSQNQYAYSADIDSEPLIIKGLTFDGNLFNQGPYENYELEQAHLIFLSADESNAGRLKAFIEDVTLQNVVADGISIYRNVDVLVYNCTAKDCFRGGFVLTGGYSIAKIFNFVTEKTWAHSWDTGIDIEVDGIGYNNTLAVDLLIDGLHVDGNVDFGVRHGSIVTCYNVIDNDVDGDSFYNFNGTTNADLEFSRCLIIPEGANGFQRILWPGRLKFNDTQFITKKHDSGDFFGVDLWWYHPSPSYDDPEHNFGDQSVEFRNCNFTSKKGAFNQVDTLHAIHTRFNKARKKSNKLAIHGSHIDSTFDVGIYSQEDLNISNTVINADLAIWRPISPLNTTLYLNLDSVMIGGKKYVQIDDNNSSNTIFHKNVVLEESSNIIIADNGLENIKFKGHRVIYGQNPPDGNTHGLVKDIYRRIVNGYYIDQWRCVSPGYKKDDITVLAQWTEVVDNLKSVINTVNINPLVDSVPEGGSLIAAFEIVRNGNTSEALAVNYSVGGNAENGKDFSFLNGTAIIPGNATSIKIYIEAFTNNEFDINKDIILNLSESPYYDLGDSASASLNINDNMQEILFPLKANE